MSIDEFVNRYFQDDLADKQLTIPEVFWPINLPPCPKIERHPVPLVDMIEIVSACLFDFGEIHCLHRCNYCGARNWFSPEVLELDKIFDFTEQCVAFKNCYNRRFGDLHSAFSLLPEEHYQSILELTHGACPACTIASALQQFPVISHFSILRPSLENAGFVVCHPCKTYGGYIEGEKTTFHMQDINSLVHIDSEDIPAMPPLERTKLRQAIESGKAVCRYLIELYDLCAAPPWEKEDGFCIRLLGKSERTLLAESSSLEDFSMKLRATGRFVNRKIIPVSEIGLSAHAADSVEETQEVENSCYTRKHPVPLSDSQQAGAYPTITIKALLEEFGVSESKIHSLMKANDVPRHRDSNNPKMPYQYHRARALGVITEYCMTKKSR